LKNLGAETRSLGLLQVQTQANGSATTQPTDAKIRELLGLLRTNGIPLVKEEKLSLAGYLRRLDEVAAFAGTGDPASISARRVQVAGLQARLAASLAGVEPLTEQQAREGLDQARDIALELLAKGSLT